MMSIHGEIKLSKIKKNHKKKIYLNSKKNS